MPYEVFGATGGAAIFRRAMLDQVGGFDESFFAFFEDADLAWRAHAHGWRALYAPGAVVYHHHSATAPARLARRSSTSSGATACARSPRTRRVGMLLVNGPWMLVYDAAYVAFASITGSTLAPLRGRVDGLREWRAYRRSGAAAPPPADACAARSASGARCSATGATPSTSRSAAERVSARRAPPASRRRARSLSASRCAPRSCTTGSRASTGRSAPSARCSTCSTATRTSSRSTPRASCCRQRLARRDRAGSPGWRGCRASASAATTRGAGAGCCPTCRTTSSTSTSSGYELVVSSSHACAAGVTHPARDAARLLLPHADALRLDARGRAQPGRRGQGRRAARPARAGCATGTGAPRSGPTSTSPTRPRWPSGSSASTVATPMVVPPPVAVDDFPRDVAARPDPLPLGSPAGRPTSARSRWPRRSAELPDLRLTMVGRGAARGAAARRLPPNVELLGWVAARAAGASCSRERRASSTSARRTSASRWSRRWPPARRCSAADRGGARDIVRPGRDGVLIADPADPAQIRAGVRELAGRSWDADELRASAAALLGGALPRAPGRGRCAPTARAEMKRTRGPGRDPGAGGAGVRLDATRSCTASCSRRAPRGDDDRHPRRAQPQPPGSPQRAVLRLWRAVQFRNAETALALVSPQPNPKELRGFEDFIVAAGGERRGT